MNPARGEQKARRGSKFATLTRKTKLESTSNDIKTPTGHETNGSIATSKAADDNWVQPDYKDKEWLRRESHRCQSCKKKFNLAAKATLCIGGHKLLRCHFCFAICSDADSLLNHFQKLHKQGDIESTLVCPFCDRAVPYKSVTCHMITMHVGAKPFQNGKDTASTTPTATDETKQENIRPAKTKRSPSPPSTDQNGTFAPSCKKARNSSPSKDSNKDASASWTLKSSSEDSEDSDDLEESDSDSSGGYDWEDPYYEKKEWLRRQCLRCQYCSNTFDEASKAAFCIATHNVLRCYICFKTYSNTETLFKHYRKRHEMGEGGGNCILCAFCDETLPYKDVSAHVIHYHIKAKLYAN